MLVCSEMAGIHGHAALTAGSEAIPAASMPGLLIGGLLLLISP
ncbi:2-isopropylmalate synthase [Nitrobacter sp. Nb-311A]|nr:2-isopropylmalate synthase [Nitrobacter sp. Nb-311A]